MQSHCANSKIVQGGLINGAEKAAKKAGFKDIDIQIDNLSASDPQEWKDWQKAKIDANPGNPAYAVTTAEKSPPLTDKQKKKQKDIEKHKEEMVKKDKRTGVSSSGSVSFTC